MFYDDSDHNAAHVEHRVVLHHNDALFPVCHAGQNRSQVMWHVLCRLNEKHGDCMHVVNPHGAESGFDPYV